MKKNILITGCSSGLGLALSKLFLQKDYKVFGISRNKPNLTHKDFYFKSCDLSNVSSVKKILNDFILNIKEIDAVYLNAGSLGKIETLNNVSVENMQNIMNVNVYANKEILDILKNIAVNNIIATSSGASINAYKGWSSYCLSKTSLNMLINLYSKEMLNTKLLCVAPGVIKTPMTDVIRFKTDENRFPSVKTLKEAILSSPEEAALKMYNVYKNSKDFESGSYIDVRLIKQA